MAPGNWQATSSMEPLALVRVVSFMSCSPGAAHCFCAARLLEPLLLQNRPGDRWAAWTVSVVPTYQSGVLESVEAERQALYWRLGFGRMLETGPAGSQQTSWQRHKAQLRYRRGRAAGKARTRSTGSDKVLEARSDPKPTQRPVVNVTVD
ncbi:hypothetical protein J7T55_001298 [Diaporthe amygdali]|uniref:uncharacterized protein n=1 Tax=Phomopsis amygdali TaxID=1214568 RepID=UPI0022FF3BE4|nr:uncharacterized protein J7T55_001298 [Diaporthe amygdali]KAJ0106774.1 hypothetical protein J7T55_001298 [Diaporthe amygdali]